MQPIDVLHLGREHVICCWRLGDVLIDPGPGSTLNTLADALEGEAPRALLLTHIHLDHAGAAGAIVRRWPETRVYVHERGAPHLADPSKLLQSAARLYGDDMERLWGEVVPVPERNLHPLAGGETVEGLRVAYTPGHASHHVCYLDVESGWAYVGDVAGVRIPPSDLVLAPTPPPDIDLEAWNESISLVAAWKPQVLALTHFGPVDRPFEHLAAMRDALVRWGTLARELDAGEFEAAVRAEVAREADEPTAASFLQAAPPEQLFLGLDRYWRRRADVRHSASPEGEA